MVSPPAVASIVDEPPRITAWSRVNPLLPVAVILTVRGRVESPAPKPAPWAPKPPARVADWLAKPVVSFRLPLAMSSPVITPPLSPELAM